MPSLWDYLRPKPPDPFDPFNSRVTYYAPGPGDRMEGGFETSQPNPGTGQRRPSTLDDVRLGISPFVTLASDPSRYGQTIKLGPQTYTSPIDRQTYTLPDVTGYVHDTGSAFKGRPDKLDVATGDFRGWSPQQASALVTADAGNRTVTPLSGDEADRAMRPIGLPEPWRATGEGENPPDAYASGPSSAPARKSMADSSLMDMFQPRSNVDNSPISFGDALAQNRASLIGLGMGLLQPRSMAVGAPAQSALSNALAGYAQGSQADAANAYRQAQLAHTKRQEDFQRSQAAQAQANFERTFARGDVTDFQKAAKDLKLTPGSPEYSKFAEQFYAPKTEQPSIVWQEDSSGNKVPYRQDPRSGTVTPVPLPGATTTAGNPYAPSGKMTTDEGKTALFADRAATAHEIITKHEKINEGVSGAIGGALQANLPAGAANILTSGERGSAMDAQRAFINALLRRESGAAINAGEYLSYGKEYFPQVGDTSTQIEDKRKHRAEVIAGLARESGKGYRPTYTFDEGGNITRGAPAYAGKGAAPAPADPFAPGATPRPVPGYGSGGFNAGATSAPQPSGGGDPLSQARDAIKQGAPKAKVIERLAKQGIRFNPKDLD